MFVEVPPPSAVAAPAVRARRSPARRLRAAAVPYLYMLPAVAGLVVWIYRPLADTLLLSFYDWNLLPTSPAEHVGTANYRQVLELPEIGEATRNTGLYILALLPFSVLLPLIVALLARDVGGRLRSFYRAAIFAPFLVAPVAAAILWRWTLAPDGGLANRLIGVFGFEPVNWLRSPSSAFVAVSVIAGWQLLGFSVLIVSAGLSNINDVYFSAARVDGAKRWRITRQITIPLLSPTLLMMVVLTVLISGQWVFPLIDTLTGGGPEGATTNLYYLIYQKAFTSFDVGLASAAGVLFFAGFAVFAVLAVWVIDRFSFYDD